MDKLSPHLDIFRSEVPALFSIGKRIFGVILFSLIAIKAIISVVLLDFPFVEFNLDFYVNLKSLGLESINGLFSVVSNSGDGVILLREISKDRLDYIGLTNYIIEHVLVLSFSYYSLSFFVYKEDVRFSELHTQVISISVIGVLILVLAYVNIKFWL